eukprot:gnl/Dysnectes_brevis/7182_a11797_146.p1 GENE.gnl/Dysnectes_brevis/7182_a11797_146~~gnl/Dysnectes_brevis/7182_a11797_146.p1  ORF type:complete len:538 (+),score=95.15 gnl/Dysnectes_brevis/7182_a11797_146:95-1708(+)
MSYYNECHDLIVEPRPREVIKVASKQAQVMKQTEECTELTKRDLEAKRHRFDLRKQLLDQEMQELVKEEPTGEPFVSMKDVDVSSLTMDEQGRLRTKDGRIVKQEPSARHSLRINRSRLLRKGRPRLVSRKHLLNKQKEQPYHDPRIRGVRDKAPPALKMFRPGEASALATATGSSSGAGTGPLSLGDWWDAPHYPSEEAGGGDTSTIYTDGAPLEATIGAGRAGVLNARFRRFLSNTGMEGRPTHLLSTNISSRVQHPASGTSQPAALPHAYLHPPLPPAPLTDAERKRKRHQHRLEKQRQRVIAERVGSIPSRPSRVTLGSIHRSLPTDAVLGPSHVERAVKEQGEARRRHRDEMNAASALSAPERKAKRKRRMEQSEETKRTGYHCALVSFGSLCQPGLRSKIANSARDCRLGGCLALFPTSGHIVPDLVTHEEGEGELTVAPHTVRVVEHALAAGECHALCLASGGPRGMRKFLRVLSRLDWGAGGMQLLWEGIEPTSQGSDFRVRMFPGKDKARRWMGRYSLGPSSFLSIDR